MPQKTSKSRHRLHNEPQPKEWLEIEPRVKALACRYVYKVRRILNRGGRAFEVTVDDLIQDAWMRLIEKKPAFDPSKQSLFEYFSRQMEERFKAVQRRAENDFDRYSYLLAAENQVDANERVGPTLYLLVDRNAVDPERATAARDELENLLAWLRDSYPDLYPLARAIALYEEEDPKEQAMRLGEDLDRIYELRRRLKIAARHFLRFTAGLNKGKKS